jgi:outer membrane protein TolC
MVMKVRWIVWAWVFGCAVAELHAAEPPTRTLAQCIEAALASSPDTAAAAAELAASRAKLEEAKAGRYGESSYTQIFGLVNEAHGNPVFSPNDKNDFFEGLGPFTRLSLEINVPLWTFGKLAAALEAAQRGLESEQAKGELRRAEVVLGIKQLYFSVLLTRQLTDVLDDMLDTLDKAITKTQKRLDDGSSAVTELDVLKLKIGRARLAKGVAEVHAAHSLGRSALARAIGLRDGETFDVADRRLTPMTARLEPLDTYLAQGIERRPEWQQVTSGVAARSAQVDLERAGYYPVLFLSTGLAYAVAANRDEQENPFAYDEFNFVHPIGVLGVRWDLNFFSRQAKVAQARAALEEVQAQQRAAASGLLLEIRKAYTELEQHRDTMKAAEEGRKAGRGWLILAVSNFDLGIGEPEELFKALGAYSEASSDYFRAVHDYNIALGALSKAVGHEVTDLEY